MAENYEIRGFLGRGSSASVYLARHRVSGRIVALKVIPECLYDEREVRIMRRLRHRRILHFIDVVSSPTDVYLVLEVAERGDLWRLFKTNGRFTEDLARRYFRQLISAVSYCHSCGIFHRDLKLQNLLLDDSGDLLLSDFGFACAAGPHSILDTICGTQPYKAPELLAGKPYFGAAVDVWACGTILFVLTAGSFPFYDIQMQRRGEYRCPEWMSEELRRLISRLLDPNPYTRITVEEIISDPWFCQGVRGQRLGGWWRRLGSWWRRQGPGGWRRSLGLTSLVVPLPRHMTLQKLWKMSLKRCWLMTLVT